MIYHIIFSCFAISRFPQIAYLDYRKLSELFAVINNGIKVVNNELVNLAHQEVVIVEVSLTTNS